MSLHDLRIDQSGDLRVIGAGREMHVKFVGGALRPGIEIQTWPWSLDPSFSVPTLNESEFVRRETNRISDVMLQGAFSISYRGGSLTTETQ